MSNILETKDLRHDFSGLEVIRGIDLQIAEGERHAIIGPNGAGKTTLFNLITGFYKPRHGKIMFGGKDVTGFKPYKLNRLGLARSFQITSTFNKLTVAENVRLGVLSRRGIRFNMWKPMSKMDAINREVDEVLERINLSEQRDVWASLLSYGKNRALEMSLTLTTDPKLILLDEPCAGMSPDETRTAVELIRKLTEGKSMVIVEHDMDVVFSLADRITVIHYGQVLATGKPDDIRENQAVKDAYLGHGIVEQ